MKSRIKALKALRFPNVTWTEKDKPVAVVDGRLYPISRMDSPVEGSAAFVASVNEKLFPRLCEFLRVQTLRIVSMRVSDVQPLVQLPDLRELSIEWNTKLANIAPLGEMKSLETLVLNDTPNVRDLSPLSGLPGLSGLEFSGGVWSRNTVISLEPIAALQSLAELVLYNLKVESGGLRPIARCKALRRLELSNQFPTADYAYLSVHLPAVECEKFSASVHVGQGPKGKDTMVVGKRKPFLSSTDDKDRLAKYEADFLRLREEFKSEMAP